MTHAQPLPIFDGHNDALLRLWRHDPGDGSTFLTGSGGGHLDLPRALAGGFAGGLFAAFVPNRHPAGYRPEDDLTITEAGWEVRPAGRVAHDYALRTAVALLARLYRLEAASAGRLCVARTARAVRECLDAGVLAAVAHFEGAEAIDRELEALPVFYAAGLRSLGLVWSRPNAFGHGVPFQFPHLPDTGPGLTAAGQALVRACNQLGILIDLAHLNERGFWDVARLSDAPLVASHTAAHAICPMTRNLTDRQLDAIGASGGVVGVVFEPCATRPDGNDDPDTPLEVIVRHVDYIAGRIGIAHVALGSDFDGATVPRTLGDAAGLPRLIAALRHHGYDHDALRLLTHANWLRVLERTWRPE
ncbi:MAG TPA: dipeptidase [Ktedonobacterales bacterium]|nr:dipeptidase [Ktedonobacterales bacterium]